MEEVLRQILAAIELQNQWAAHLSKQLDTLNQTAAWVNESVRQQHPLLQQQASLQQQQIQSLDQLTRMLGPLARFGVNATNY